MSNQLIVKGKYTTVTQSNFAGNPTAQPVSEHIDYPTSLSRLSAQANSVDQKEVLTAASINDDNQYNVVLFEKPQLSSMIVNRHAYYNTSAQSNNLYDANRNLCGIQNFNDSTSLANDPYQSALTILTSIWNGFPLARTTVPLNMANKKSTTARENLNFTTTQFHSLATYTINRDALASQIDGKLKPNFLQTNTSQGGKSVYVNDINSNSYVKTAVQSGQSAKQLTLSTVARAVSQSYPAASPDTLTIMGEGQTIADVMQNDSSSGFTAGQVAAMNGMNPDQKLVQNMPVRMPQYISSSNRVGQVTNFDIFTAALSAGFMPYVETRFKEERSNPFRELLNIVLVGAATFAGISLGIGPVLTAIFSDVLGGAFAAGISAGVGAAAGNALGQELAVDFGLQDKFRLKSAVEAGFLAGVGGGIRAAQFTPTQTVATLAAADAGMQVAEIRLGIRQKFNFNEVGSTIINATMNGLLISNPNQTWSEYVAQSLFKNTAAVLAMNALYGGSPDISNMAAQILGSSVVDVAARGINSVKDQMEMRRRAAMRPIFDPRAHDFDDQDFVVPVKAEVKSSRSVSPMVGASSVSRSALAKAVQQAIGLNVRDSKTATPRSSSTWSRVQNILANVADAATVVADFGTINKNVMRYADAIVEGVDAGKADLANLVMHPIDTLVALDTLGWDLLNAYTKANYGIASAGSMERNAMRMQSIKNGLVEMSHADGPALTKMIMRELTVGIFSAGVGSGVGRAAVFARGAAVGRGVVSEGGMFAQISKLADIQTLDHSAIKFTQASVNDVDALTQSMKINGWKGAPIDVVRLSRGVLVSMDNTRLLAASRANIPVKAIIHEGSQPLSIKLAERFTTKKGGVPSTWEEAALYRINKQNYLYRDKYPSGSGITGAIN